MPWMGLQQKCLRFQNGCCSDVCGEAVGKRVVQMAGIYSLSGPLYAGCPGMRASLGESAFQAEGRLGTASPYFTKEPRLLLQIQGIKMIPLAAGKSSLSRVQGGCVRCIPSIQKRKGPASSVSVNVTGQRTLESSHPEKPSLSQREQGQATSSVPKCDSKSLNVCQIRQSLNCEVASSVIQITTSKRGLLSQIGQLAMHQPQ